MKKYLDLTVRGDNTILVNEHLPVDGLLGIFEYNNGIFCYVPRIYQYLNLAVGYKKDRDTALIRVKGACIMPYRWYVPPWMGFSLLVLQPLGPIYFPLGNWGPRGGPPITDNQGNERPN